MADTDWQLVDGVPSAWFDAPSMAAGAEFAGLALELSSDTLIDLRSKGCRVRFASVADAAEGTAIARDLGLAADPAALQVVSVVVETPDLSAVQGFWLRVLGYASAADDQLTDPLDRDPTMRFVRSPQHPEIRNRIHLDVVRPAAAVAAAGVGEASGPYGVCHVDADGNEVDLVPGDPLGEGSETADWQTVFSAVACYHVASTTQQCALAAAVAQIADAAGFPLLVDLRPGLVIIDSGKDRWDADAHGLDLDFTELAARIQRAARSVDAVAAPELARFVQLFLDAADVKAVRGFWSGVLGYRPDPRSDVSDIVDPRWLNPVLVFQHIDESETERRRQRGRIQIELAVPAEFASTRVAEAVAAGGRLLDESSRRWRIADPEHNELVIVAS